jgi:hypothetical protein
MLGGLLYLYATALLLAQILIWLRMLQLFGPMPLRVFGEMLRLTSESLIGRLLLYILALCAVGIAALLAFDRELGLGHPRTSAIVAILSTCAAAFIYICQPPAVLVLTRSNPSNARLVQMLNSAISPLKAVALLNPYRLGIFTRLFSADNLHISNIRAWKSCVHRLIEIAPVVVVDVREESESLNEETLLMLAPERARKAIFLTGPNGECPALQSHGIDPKISCLRTASEEGLARVLKSWKWSVVAPSNFRNRPDTAAPKQIVTETVHNYPSMLTLAVVDCFDSRQILDIASKSDKYLIGLQLPLSVRQPNASTRSKMLQQLWEFVHDDRLAFIFFESCLLIAIRNRFLGEASELLRSRSEPNSLSDFRWPLPIMEEVDAFMGELRDSTLRRGYTHRTIRCTECNSTETDSKTDLALGWQKRGQMERIKVLSPNVASIGYDATRKTLEVEYLNGELYQFYHVPRTIYDDLMAAPSKGQFIREILKESHAWARIDERYLEERNKWQA